MKIVNLDKSYLGQICGLYANGFEDGWNLNMLSSAFDTGRFCVYGAFDGDSLVGAVSVSVAMDEADLESIFVLENYRHQKIATLLFDNMQNLLLSKGIKKIFLEVRKSNTPAKTFYLKSGFSEISVRKKYYPDGEDALILVKEF